MLAALVLQALHLAHSRSGCALAQAFTATCRALPRQRGPMLATHGLHQQLPLLLLASTPHGAQWRKTQPLRTMLAMAGRAASSTGCALAAQSRL